MVRCSSPSRSGKNIEDHKAHIHTHTHTHSHSQSCTCVHTCVHTHASRPIFTRADIPKNVSLLWQTCIRHTDDDQSSSPHLITPPLISFPHPQCCEKKTTQTPKTQSYQWRIQGGGGGGGGGNWVLPPPPPRQIEIKYS